MTSSADEKAAKKLLSAAAVRERAHEMLAICEADGLAEWRVDLSRLHAVADFTAEVVRENYPNLKVPFHARWRHFMANGRDLWAESKKPGNQGLIGSVSLSRAGEGTVQLHER